MNKIWEEFSSNISKMGELLEAESVPQDSLTQAEGMRYLVRLLRYASINCIEYTDPRWPQFTSAPNPNMMTKIGADNPDNVYLRANISGKYSYRITGTRGTVPLLTFGSRINRYHQDGTMLQTGDLHSDDLVCDPDGRFTFIASVDKPESGNWLPLSPESNLISVRQTHQDRRNETPATLTIECLDTGLVPEPVSEDELAERLERTTALVTGTAETFSRWTRMFMTRPNELPDWGQDYFQKAGGDPTIFYLQGYWTLGEDEALVVESEVPDCEYWNFVLQNWWMESLDYNSANIYVNNHTAKLNDDGTVTIVIAHRDPGYGNWLSTTGHSEGTIMMRWVKAESHPLPRVRVVKI